MASFDTSSITSDSDTYECGPGLCVIINNMQFNAQGLKDLPSGKKDEASLKLIFRILGFDVIAHQNLTATDIKSTVERYSKMEHTGAFFLIISSHGKEGVVFGTDGGEVAVHDLNKLFYARECPSLAGIPKVFIIDACRGKKKEGVDCSTKAGPQSIRSTMTTRDKNTADIMTIFASARDHTAGCDEDEGSFFIQAFVKVLKKVSADENLTDMMKKVQRKMKTQTPHIETSFSRSYYITRSTKLNAYCELDKKLQDAVCQWLPVREKTIKEAREVAENLQENYRRANISRIIGSAISIVGTALIVIGSALIPSTASGSLAFFILGMVASSLGETLAVGAPIAKIAVEKWKIKKAKQKEKEDQCQLKNIQEKMTKMRIILKSMSLSGHKEDRHNNYSTCPCICAILMMILCSCIERIKAGISFLNSVTSAIIEILWFCKLALRIGGAIAKGSSIVLNVILLPMNIYEIMQSSSKLESRFVTKTINNQLKHASDLEQEMKDAKNNTEELLMEASNLLK